MKYVAYITEKQRYAYIVEANNEEEAKEIAWERHGGEDINGNACDCDDWYIARTEIKCEAGEEICFEV